MTFKYSICYPDKKEIEYKNDPISSMEVLSIARTYPWLEQLELLHSLHPDKIYYNPSLDFSCPGDEKNFGLTAHYNHQKQLEFSLWYCRAKRIKVFFGLWGEKEKMIVDDAWSFDIDTAMNFLEHFVNKNYQIIETLYKK